jgi:hypothetical protein
MADNTDEEHLHNLTNTQPENPPEEIFPANDTETISPNKVTENMEVHHHAHHEGKKNWKSYFWEFLMLFLAVFCGFLAEYRLEHIIEKEREKELAVSFYNELKGDSLSIQIAIGNRRRKDAAFNYMKKYFSDSSITLCSKAFSINFFYTFATYSPSIFEPNDAILNQLKNSGSLRYFKNQELQELTGKISVAISNLKNRNEMEWTYVHEIINPFFIKHNDQNWTDKIGHDSSIFIFVALQNYENADEQIPFHFQKPGNFDRVEAINIVGLYQLTFRGSSRKQYHDYEILNAKLLEVLRKEYKMK